MVNKFTVVILLLLAIPTFASRKKWTQAENMGFAGPIKSVSGTHQSFAPQPKEPDGFSIVYSSSCEECEFDREGNQVRSGTVENGHFRGGVMHEIRDELGRVKSEIWENEKGEVISHHDYTNGPAGKERDDFYLNDKLVNSTTFRYDNRGNIIESNVYKPDHALDSHNEAAFDNEGNQIESLSEGPGENYSHVIQTYNPETGHLESFTSLNRDGLVRLQLRLHDDTVLSFWQKSGDKPTYGSGLCFGDDEGTERECRNYNWDGTYLTTQYTFTDKSKRNPLKATRYDTDHQVVMEVKYDYEFDSVGNWTKRTVWVKTPESGKWQLLEKDARTLTYFGKEAKK